MSERALATLEQIGSITPIEGADLIVCARVRDWDVVVKKDEFKEGDACIYFEIDSMLPLADPAFAFLETRGKRFMPDGTLAHRLKTAKLRGVVSQGLALPVTSFAHRPLDLQPTETGEIWGCDVTDQLGITKYEPAIPAELKGAVNGDFPTHLVMKTDSERVQNLGRQWDRIKQSVWYALEKIDGTSLTVINDAGNIRVCGRNWEQKLDNGTAYVEAALRFAHLLQEDEFVQGELYGEGIQKNPLGLKGTHVALFAYGRVREGTFHPLYWPDWAREMMAPCYTNLDLPDTIAEAVAQVDGIKSLVSPERLAEGVVWHLHDNGTLRGPLGRPNFKAISNKYILKHEAKDD